MVSVQQALDNLTAMMNAEQRDRRGAGRESPGCGDRLLRANAMMRHALQRISRWEFPDTGRKHDDGTPISYGVAFGSNGERDFMRKVANDALKGESKC